MNKIYYRVGKPLGLIFFLCFISLSALAEEHTEVTNYQIFQRAPTPEKLANILFPPVNRSIGRLRSPNTKAQDRQFGLVINFAFDSAEILPDSVPLLEALGEMFGIETVSSQAVVIEGHTDSIGSASYNQRLSEKRARSIKEYLTEHFGVDPQRLITVGKGERDLYSIEEPRAAVNRRVSFRPARK